jgi:histidine triad (HIT) family protein
MTDCIFCKMINGEIPVTPLIKDKKYLIILDRSPINPGHTLVIPKKHSDYIFDLNDKEYSELMLKAKEVAKILKKKLNPKRVGMAIEGFGVPHVHIHLVPENKGNELNPERAKPMSQEELNKITEKITNE